MARRKIKSFDTNQNQNYINYENFPHTHTRLRVISWKELMVG